MDKATKELLKSLIPGLYEISSYSVLADHEYISFYYVAIIARNFTKNIDIHTLGIDNIIYANYINIIIVNSLLRLNNLRTVLMQIFSPHDIFNVCGQISDLKNCIEYVIDNEQYLIHYESTLVQRAKKLKKMKVAILKYGMRKYNAQNIKFLYNNSDPLFIIILDIFKNDKYNKYFVDVITKQIIKYHINYHDPYLSCDQWKQHIVFILRQIICHTDILSVKEFEVISDKMHILSAYYSCQDNNKRFEIFKELVKNDPNKEILSYDDEKRSSIIALKMWDNLFKFLYNSKCWPPVGGPTLELNPQQSELITIKATAKFLNAQKINHQAVAGTLYAQIDGLCIPIQSGIPDKQYVDIVENSIRMFVKLNKTFFKCLRNYEIITYLLFGFNDNSSILSYIKDSKYIIINYVST
jgi:hypothetical protein